MTSDRRVTISISMPAKSAEAVEQAAKKLGCSLSKYICEAAEKRAGVKARKLLGDSAK